MNVLHEGKDNAIIAFAPIGWLYPCSPALLIHAAKTEIADMMQTFPCFKIHI